jgi:carbon monoxide dehydrogenase subunit G
VTSFTVSTSSAATLSAGRGHVWDALTDTALLARLTPYVRRIDDQGDRWTWHLVQIPVLGSMVSPSFTEVMTFDKPSGIDFVHDPDRTDEKAGVEGRYTLKETHIGTDVSIELAITVDLPFPSLARPAVHPAMRALVATMGYRFSHNLVRHLERAS